MCCIRVGVRLRLRFRIRVEVRLRLRLRVRLRERIRVRIRDRVRIRVRVRVSVRLRLRVRVRVCLSDPSLYLWSSSICAGHCGPTSEVFIGVVLCGWLHTLLCLPRLTPTEINLTLILTLTKPVAVATTIS